MTLVSGTRLGPYEIVAPIGAGGMGEVYRARDTRLGRTVAIKVLSPNFAADARLRTRFEREAKTVSSLNHPHICTLHDVGRENGIDFLVLEYCEGTTLAQRVVQGPLPIKETLEYGFEIADALDKAHRQGIVHRDLKPSNIMLTGSGVKLLDFGLAKHHTDVGSAETTTTMEEPVTQEGQLLGTIQYMAPEMFRGQKADARSDIFALGLVLYEMTTGKPAFAAKSKADLIAAILVQEPLPIHQIDPLVPPELEHLIERCLAKKPEERWQSAHDVAEELKWLSGSRAKTHAAAARRRTVLGLGLVLAVIALATIYFPRSISQRPEPIQAVAVLPFVNHNPQTEHLSDGMTEAIINSLSQLPDVRVMARTTVFRYKGQAIDPREVGRELKVPVIVVGTLQPHAGRHRIHAELMKVSDGSQIWGGQYEVSVSDLMTAQMQISENLARQLRGRLTAEQQQRVARRPTRNPEAYELYLQGMHAWNKRTKEDLERSIGFFDAALEKDPGFAIAYVGLSNSYGVMAGRGMIPSHEGQVKAQAAAEKALELDGSLPEAYAALAAGKFTYYWDFPGAERNFRRAIELNPNYATAREWYAELLRNLGRFAEARAELDRAYQLDPFSPAINHGMCFGLLEERRYVEAIAFDRRVSELDPSFGHPSCLFWSYVELRDFEKAASVLQSRCCYGLEATDSETLIQAFKKSGERGFFEKYLEILVERRKQRYVPAIGLAMGNAQLGKADEAFAWLEQAYQERSVGMNLLYSHPGFENIRSDPRFDELGRRVGLPQARR